MEEYIPVTSPSQLWRRVKRSYPDYKSQKEEIVDEIFRGYALRESYERWEAFASVRVEDDIKSFFIFLKGCVENTHLIEGLFWQPATLFNGLMFTITSEGNARLFEKDALVDMESIYIMLGLKEQELNGTTDKLSTESVAINPIGNSYGEPTVAISATVASFYIGSQSGGSVLNYTGNKSPPTKLIPKSIHNKKTKGKKWLER